MIFIYQFVQFDTFYYYFLNLTYEIPHQICRTNIMFVIYNILD